MIAFSSGNHGIGVAYAAQCLGMTATIVVPRDAPEAKIDRIRHLGGNIVLYDRLSEDREQVASALQDKNPAPLVKPYDDWQTIAGQGTCGAEVIVQGPRASTPPSFARGWRARCGNRHVSQITLSSDPHLHRRAPRLARPSAVVSKRYTNRGAGRWRAMV